MPDPRLYLQAICASLVCGAICMRAISGILSRTRFGNRQFASIIGMSGGVVGGLWVLAIWPAIPPASGLDRLLCIVLPAGVLIESAASFPGVPRSIVQTLRITLIAMSGRILLHGSGYLNDGESKWSDWRLVGVWFVTAALLAATWGLLRVLSERSTDVSISLSVAMTTLFAGVLVMMAGYVNGGAVALPFTGALLGVAAASYRIQPHADPRGAIGIGILGLFCLLFVGRFFGRLTTGTAMVVFTAPLMCWFGEIPKLRPRKAWQVTALRLTLVAVPLIVELAIAKSRFDRDMAPLLTVK